MQETTNNLYQIMKSDGLSDNDIVHLLKIKFGDKWDKAAQKIGMPVWSIADTMSDKIIEVPGVDQLQNQSFVDAYNEGNINMDTQTTMTPEEQAVSTKIESTPGTMYINSINPEVNIDDKGNPSSLNYNVDVTTAKDQFKAFQTGDAATFAGIGKAVLDVLNAVGIDTPEANKYIDTAIKQFNEELKNYDEKHPGLNAGDIGKIAPTLATLPVTYTSPASATAVEGALGYAYSRGEGNDEVTSGLAGLLSGGTAGLGVKFINKITDYINEKDVDKLYSYLKDYFNVDDKTAEEAYKNYLKVMQPGKSEMRDRVKALVQWLGDEGATITKRAASTGNHETAKGIIKELTDRVDTVKDITKPQNIEDSFKVLTESADSIKKDYGDFVNSKVGTTLNKIKYSLPKEIDEATKTNNQILKELLDNPTFENYIEAYQTASKLERKTRDAQKALKYKKLKNSIDEEIKKALSPEDYVKWREVNKNYAVMSKVMDSDIGKEISEAVKGNKTWDYVIEKLSKSKSVKDASLFRAIEQLAGPEHTANIEKAVINKWIESPNRNIKTWDYIASKIKDNGFVTEEGKNLQSLIDTLAEQFNVDDKLRAVIPNSTKGMTGWSDDLISKAKFRLIENIWEALYKKLPTENARFMRKMDTLAKVLKDPNKVRELSQLVPKGEITNIETIIPQVLAQDKELFDQVTSTKEGRMWLYKVIDKIKGLKDSIKKQIKKSIMNKDYNGMRKGSIYIGGKRNKPSIKFAYKLNEEINKLKDNQKYSLEQLTKYLVNKGVSPKEIEASEIFNNKNELTLTYVLNKLPKNSKYNEFMNELKLSGLNPDTITLSKEDINLLRKTFGKTIDDIVNKTLTGKEWKQLVSTGKHIIREASVAEPRYSHVALPHTNNYQENLDLISKDGIDNHFTDAYETVHNLDSSDITALGWRRFSELPISENEKATVLNEIQSDWEVASRQGKASPFPMTAKKYYTYSIVKGINRAIEDGTNRLIIPIDRDNTALQGTEGVTKFYENLVSSLNDIKKKLGKQGIKLKIEKRDLSKYPTPQNKKYRAKLNNILNRIKKAKSIEDLDNIVMTDDYYELVPEADALAEMAAEFEDLSQAKHFLTTMTSTRNILEPQKVWDIKIEIDPAVKDKAIWYIYSLLGALGLNHTEKENNNE